MLFLDWFLHFLHFVVIIINTTFWIWPKTLRLAQVMVTLTVISWFGFGIVYGFGYCFLTDWQWQVKTKLGETDLPYSYIKYVLDEVTGKNWSPALVDTWTLIVFVVSVLGCLGQTFRSRKRTGP